MKEKLNMDEHLLKRSLFIMENQLIMLKSIEPRFFVNFVELNHKQTC